MDEDPVMKLTDEFPGTVAHKKLLQAIVEFYQYDTRILAISVFGSLGRGNWDAYSDVDLDIVISDDITVEVLQEFESLCGFLESIGEYAAMIIPDGEDAGDVVFASLMQMSIRYHELSTTKPAILDTLMVLASRISDNDLIESGEANRKPMEESLGSILDRCVRYTAVADVYIKRRQIWMTIEVLHRMRRLIFEMYASSHRQPRPEHAFEDQVDERIQELIGGTLPQYDPYSQRESLIKLIAFLLEDIGTITDGKLFLNDGQVKILERISSHYSD